jgi:aspartyl-tRNA(Asn)/glutamyl-tRNA(Gln) amidotransferase subunit C
VDLEKILECVGKLEELDTEGVDPLVYLSDSSDCLRTDRVIGISVREDILRNAPETDHAFFLVPKVIDTKNTKDDE